MDLELRKKENEFAILIRDFHVASAELERYGQQIAKLSALQRSKLDEVSTLRTKLSQRIGL